MHSSSRFINSCPGWLAYLFQSRRYSNFYLAWYRECSVSKRQKKKTFVMLFVNDILRRWGARQRFKHLVSFTIYFLFPFKSISVFPSLSITSHRSYHWILSWTKEKAYNNRGWYFSSLSKTSDMKKRYPESKRKEEKEKDKEVAETPMVRTTSFLFYLTANPWNINLNVKGKSNVQIHKRSCSSLRHVWSTQLEQHTILMSHFNACFLIILPVGWILDIWWIRE